MNAIGGEAAGDSDADDRTEPPRPSVSLPWAETADRELRDFVCTATIVFLLALALASALRALQGAEGNQWGAAAFSLALAAVGWLSWYGPMAGVGARASVDGDGLWVRHIGWTLWPTDLRIELSPVKHLPATQIGQVEVVEGKRRRELWRRAVALDYNGRRIGWTTTNLDHHTDVAVLVEQVDPASGRPWWLIKCHQPEELVAALQLARDQADAGRQRQP